MLQFTFGQLLGIVVQIALVLGLAIGLAGLRMETATFPKVEISATGDFLSLTTSDGFEVRRVDGEQLLLEKGSNVVGYFSSRGGYVTTFREGVARTYSLPSLSLAAEFRSDGAKALCFDEDDSLFMLVERNEIRVHHSLARARDRLLASLGADSVVSTVAMAEDARIVAVAFTSGNFERVAVVQWPNGPLQTYESVFTDIRSLECSNCGRLALARFWSGDVEVFDLQRGRSFRLPDCLTAEMSRDGTHIVLVTESNGTRVLEIMSVDSGQFHRLGTSSSPVCATFGKAGDVFYLMNDGGIERCDVRGGEVLAIGQLTAIPQRSIERMMQRGDVILFAGTGIAQLAPIHDHAAALQGLTDGAVRARIEVVFPWALCAAIWLIGSCVGARLEPDPAIRSTTVTRVCCSGVLALLASIHILGASLDILREVTCGTLLIGVLLMGATFKVGLGDSVFWFGVISVILIWDGAAIVRHSLA